MILNGRKRKEAADCVGEAISIMPVYQRAPSYAYDIGGITLNKQGVLTIGDSDEALPKVLIALQKAEFYTPEEEKPPEKVEITPGPARGTADEAEEETPAEAMKDIPAEIPPAEEPQHETAAEVPPRIEQHDRLVIQIPSADFSETALENLRLLVASKALLLKKATGAVDLSIRRNGETIDFTWFEGQHTPEEVTAYMHLISKLCDMAKRQQRVLAVEHPVENEKYAFRCFLLRLGFIGEDYTETRRILLCNLDGNGSHKSGNGKPREPKAPATAVAGRVPKASAAKMEQQKTQELFEPSPKTKFSIKKLFGGSKK